MSIDFRSLEVGPLESNCYVIWDTETRIGAVIDPGGDKSRIISLIDSNNVSIEWVLLTHGHFDHVFYAAEIADECGAKIGMQALDIIQIIQSLEVGEQFYPVAEFVPFTPTDLLNDDDIITIGNSEVKVLHTPGHSQGGLCFGTDAGVFCGDTIFAGSVGRSDFPGGSHEQLISSIKEKILTLDDSVELFPGHGPSTTVGEERATNWYLR